jgi:hypothetical protein
MERAAFYPNKDKAEHAANKSIIDAQTLNGSRKKNIVANLAAYNQRRTVANNKLSISGLSNSITQSHGPREY